jgi:hypothetical protein
LQLAQQQREVQRTVAALKPPPQPPPCWAVHPRQQVVRALPLPPQEAAQAQALPAARRVQWCQSQR